MRKEYEFLRKSPGLYCKLVNRIVQGNTVIDHEEIWAGERRFYGVAVYQVERGKIKTVRFYQ
jgi:hypothetical protein